MSYILQKLFVINEYYMTNHVIICVESSPVNSSYFNCTNQLLVVTDNFEYRMKNLQLPLSKGSALVYLMPCFPAGGETFRINFGVTTDLFCL